MSISDSTSNIREAFKQHLENLNIQGLPEYALVSFGYSPNILMSYSKAIKLMEILEGAQIYENWGGSPQDSVKLTSKIHFNMEKISSEYAALLTFGAKTGLSVKEVQEIHESLKNQRECKHVTDYP